MASSPFETPVLAPSRGRPPNASDLTRHVFWADIYRVLPSSQLRASLESGVQVPSGAGSHPYLVEGFHGPETTETGIDYRWTDGNGLIMLPWPVSDSQTPADFCLSLDVTGIRPPPERPAQIVVSAEGVTLYEGELGLDVARTVLHIPGESIQNTGSPKLEITLASDTWDPSTVSGQTDKRELGVVFYGLELSPGAECPP